MLVTQSCVNLYDSMDWSPQAPLSMGFSRQEYWSGLPFPSSGDLPDPGMEPASPARQADSLPLHHLGGSSIKCIHVYTFVYGHACKHKTYGLLSLQTSGHIKKNDEKEK